MGVNGVLATGQVLEMFAGEVGKHGGSVRDTFDDGERLFVRSVLPAVEEVRAKDGLQGGVAMKYCAGEAWVHPYVYRLVCRNGAIMAQIVDERHLTVFLEGQQEQATLELAEAVRTCCEAGVFETSVAKIRALQGSRINFALTMMPMLERLSDHGRESVLQIIMKRLFDGKERSGFGLMNAITSVARDERDPEMKWELEKLGGGIASDERRVALPVPRWEAERQEEWELVS